MINNKYKDVLENYYMHYDNKVKDLVNLLSKKYKVSYTYTTKYNKEIYPLHVINIKNLCIIILNEYEIDINTKITRNALLNLDLNVFNKYDFDIYSPYDYFDDLYQKGMSNDEIIGKINETRYKNFGFTFIVPLDMSNIDVSKLIDLISNNNFKY